MTQAGSTARLTGQQTGRKTVGVLGGMGPAATLDFFAKLLEHTRAERDQDHLRVLIDSNPNVPDRNAALTGTGPSPGPVLAAMARGLERAGADFLVMACNTAHAFEADIRRATRLPFVGIVAETVKAALELKPDATRVGLLAADGCLAAGLYQHAFAARDVSVALLEPAAQARFMALLYRVKAGDTGNEVRREMKGLAHALAGDGAALLVAGCTEVPLVLGPEDASAPLADSTEALVRATIRYGAGHDPLPEILPEPSA